MTLVEQNFFGRKTDALVRAIVLVINSKSPGATSWRTFPKRLCPGFSLSNFLATKSEKKKISYKKVYI